MRPIAAPLAALLLLVACDRANPPPQFDAPPSPILFEVANDEGEVEGWLFGTMHSLPTIHNGERIGSSRRSQKRNCWWSRAPISMIARAARHSSTGLRFRPASLTS